MLEDIALYVQYKPCSFLRHFGFAVAVGNQIEALDTETQEICLFILSKMSLDSVLVQEVYEEGTYKAIKRLLLSHDMRIRLASLQALDPICQFEAVRQTITAKVRFDDVGYCLAADDDARLPREESFCWDFRAVETVLQADCHRGMQASADR